MLSLFLAVDFLDVVDYADKISVGVLLIVIVVGAFRGWWVPGTIHKKVVEELDACRKRLNHRR